MARAARRSTDEVRARIINAAAAEFSANGYANSTVRAVAAEAGVSHSVLHRHFPTKEELFSAALVAPFLRFFEDLATVWDDDPGRTWTDAELTHELVTHMYTNLSEYRLNLADLLMVRESDRDLLREVRQGLDGVRIKLQGLEKRGARARQWTAAPPRRARQPDDRRARGRACRAAPVPIEWQKQRGRRAHRECDQRPPERRLDGLVRHACQEAAYPDVVSAV